MNLQTQRAWGAAAQDCRVRVHCPVVHIAVNTQESPCHCNLDPALDDPGRAGVETPGLSPSSHPRLMAFPLWKPSQHRAGLPASSSLPHPELAWLWQKQA